MLPILNQQPVKRTVKIEIDIEDVNQGKPLKMQDLDTGKLDPGPAVSVGRFYYLYAQFTIADRIC